MYRDGVSFILRSSDAGGTVIRWGELPQDVPVPTDYDGDGKTDSRCTATGCGGLSGRPMARQSQNDEEGAPQDIPLQAEGKTMNMHRRKKFLSEYRRAYFPYCGELVNLLVEDDERRELTERANKLSSLQLSPRSMCDLELLSIGVSPWIALWARLITRAVLEEMRLANGTLFPIPITLPVQDVQCIRRRKRHCAQES